MNLLSAVLPLTIVLVLSSIIVRVATIVLRLTGLDERTAKFQALSAFTGTGFTTKEAETIVGDDVRRKTVSILMVVGKIGFVSVIGGVLFSFDGGNWTCDMEKIGALVLLLFCLYKFTSWRVVNGALTKFIEKRIIARGIIKQTGLEELFHLPKGYGIAKLTITDKNTGKGLTLAQAGFIGKDILVLSIEREDNLIAFPHANDVLKTGDKLLCYGHLESIRSYSFPAG
ncbi:MAG: hypothetical protein PHP69_05505 [Candidatus Omnitrophica bacterium]|nr:hypothetical protein [Candidatus Omnitrophota bacterium]